MLRRSLNQMYKAQQCKATAVVQTTRVVSISVQADEDLAREWCSWLHTQV